MHDHPWGWAVHGVSLRQNKSLSEAPKAGMRRHTAQHDVNVTAPLVSNLNVKSENEVGKLITGKFLEHMVP